MAALRISSLRTDQVCLVLALLLASFFLAYHLGEIPGLHADEAWVGLKAHSILQGERPWVGMNEYTGPIHAYLLAPLFKVFGFRVGVLRSLVVVFSVISVILYYFVALELFGGFVAGSASLLLASSPFFVAFGRQATENF